MSTDEHNDARRYALAIAREVSALDQLLSGTTEPDEIADALAELELEHLPESFAPERIASEAVYAWINGTALDVRVLRDVRDGSARVEILRTCGGPRCEIVRDTTNGTVVSVEVWDASAHHVHQMNPDHFAAWLDDMSDAGLGG